MGIKTPSRQPYLRSIARLYHHTPGVNQTNRPLSTFAPLFFDSIDKIYENDNYLDTAGSQVFENREKRDYRLELDKLHLTIRLQVYNQMNKFMSYISSDKLSIRSI
jgi:hypothetical protein